MKSKLMCVIIGIIVGALVFGGLPAKANLEVTATTSKVMVDGVEKNVDAYNINGNNYFKLRDFTAAIDIGVWWDGENNTIHIETDKGYDPDYTGGDMLTATDTSENKEPVSVNVVLMDSLFEDFSSMDPEVYAENKGFLKVEKYDDHFVATMTKEKYDETMAELKMGLDQKLEELVNADFTRYIRAISSSQHYRVITISVDRELYSATLFDVVPSLIDMVVTSYQSFLNEEPGWELVVVDVNTGDVISKTQYYPK